MTHSKGPWFKGKHGTPDYAPQYGIYADGGKSIAIVTGENAEADAQIFASALGLLEACEYLIETCEDEIGEQSDSALRKLRKAIAAAREIG